MKKELITVASVVVIFVGCFILVDSQQRSHIRELATVRAQYEDASKRLDDIENCFGEFQIRRDKLEDLTFKTAKLTLDLYKSTQGIAKLTADIGRLSIENEKAIKEMRKGAKGE